MVSQPHQSSSSQASRIPQMVQPVSSQACHIPQPVSSQAYRIPRIVQPVPPQERSIREMVRGAVLISFGGQCMYEMRSRMHPKGPPRSIYIYDARHRVDPQMHPLHGRHSFSRVYRGWYHSAENQQDGIAREGDIAIKWARGAGVRALQHECANYERMAEMQGEIIPKLYDYYQETLEGVDVACLILQWCGGVVAADHKLFIAQKLELVCALHATGWAHGNMPEHDHDRHFVVDETDITGNPLRLVDLTCAHRHNCLLNRSQPSCCREVDFFTAMRLINL